MTIREVDSMADDSQQSSTVSPDSDSSSEKVRKKRRMFRVVALLIGVLPFPLLEIGLRICNVASPEQIDDPLVGFSKVQRLFELNEDAGKYRTSRSRELFFGVQEFAGNKPQNGYRIFCLGGSTVRGRPFEPDSAFSKWLELELSSCDSDRTFESVNCGGLSYASYRLRVLLEEVLQYEPDLIVLCTGHNEFLEDRTYSSLKERTAARAWIEDRASSLHIVNAVRHVLARDDDTAESTSERTVLEEEVNARLDDPTGYSSYHHDPEWQSGVLTHFDLSVRTMIRMCEAAGVPVVLVLPGANIRDNAPFKSEHPADLTADQELAWQRAFDDGEAEDDPELALGHFRIAESIDDGYALLSFRMARCLDRLGRYFDARHLYHKAKDDDVCPLRILGVTCDILKSVAEDTDTPLVDARRLFMDSSPNEIPGSDWYTDHVHPTIYGHQLIAREIVDVMRHEGHLQTATRWNADARRAVYESHLNDLGPAWLANGRRRVGWLESWAQRHRLQKENDPVDARGFLHRGFRQYGFDEPFAAWKDFNEALKRDPKTEAAILAFAFELFDQGRSAAATEIVDALNEAVTPLIEIELRVAQYVLAIAREDHVQAKELRSLYGELFRQLPETATPWLSALPARGLQD